MFTRGPVLSIVAALASAGCAGEHIVHHPSSTEIAPHITWEIRAGGAEGHDRMVCESEQRQPICVLTASTPGRRERTTIHLYMHGAASPVRYEGSWELPFLEGTGTIERPLRADLRAGASAESLSVAGVVASKPGTYRMSISLKVVQGDRSLPPIEQAIAVTVK